MKKIGIISDTHGCLDNGVCIFLNDADEIWHAGDIGNAAVADCLETLKPLRAVYGNIDGEDLRLRYPSQQRFWCEDTDVLITHIGGFAGHYDRSVRAVLAENPPKLFVCGHSHILRIMYDPALKMLCVNPGAAGRFGFHKVRTAVRFVIDGGDIRDMEIGEWQR